MFSSVFVLLHSDFRLAFRLYVLSEFDRLYCVMEVSSYVTYEGVCVSLVLALSFYFIATLFLLFFTRFVGRFVEIEIGVGVCASSSVGMRLFQ